MRLNSTESVFRELCLTISYSISTSIGWIVFFTTSRTFFLTLHIAIAIGLNFYTIVLNTYNK